MKKLALACGLTLAACSSPAAPPPTPAKPPTLGLDLSAFDRTVRPQDDLFQHVNGGWLQKTEIPADKSSYGAFDILFDKAQADLKAIVETAAKSAAKTPGSEAQKIGDFPTRPGSISSNGWDRTPRSRRRRSCRGSARRSAIRASGATTRSSRSRTTTSSAT